MVWIRASPPIPLKVKNSNFIWLEVLAIPNVHTNPINQIIAVRLDDKTFLLLFCQSPEK